MLVAMTWMIPQMTALVYPFNKKIIHTVKHEFLLIRRSSLHSNGLRRPLILNTVSNNISLSGIENHTIEINQYSEIPQAKPSDDRIPTLNKQANTGGLRRLPVLKSEIELINRARKNSRFVTSDTSIGNIRNRAKKHAAQTLDTIVQSLCVPLRDFIQGYATEYRRLHPFEKVVADLTVRSRQKKDGMTLSSVLDDLNEARKDLLETGKDYIAKAKKAESSRNVESILKEGEEQLYNLFSDAAGPSIALLIDLQKSLRTTPAVRLDTPAVVLVGAPNVGKSSIVRAISSGTPEVNNYPFTTRGMTLGHVEVFWSDDFTISSAHIPTDIKSVQRRIGQRDYLKSYDDIKDNGGYAFSQLCQVMDSPGLLVRESDSDRNEMELLTLSAMMHLPTAVMYVMDLSGGAGDKCSSIQNQLHLRRDMRARFPRRPWIDVVSKIDLGVAEGTREKLEDILDGAPYIELSIKDGIGLDQLKTEVLRMLGEVRIVLDAIAATDERTGK